MVIVPPATSAFASNIPTSRVESSSPFSVPVLAIVTSDSNKTSGVYVALVYAPGSSILEQASSEQNSQRMSETKADEGGFTIEVISTW